MAELIEGKVYKLKNGELKRLDIITENFLSYSVLISKDVWMKLTSTYRYQVEKDFTEGEIIV